jgi:hypothetical protein
LPDTRTNKQQNRLWTQDRTKNPEFSIIIKLLKSQETSIEIPILTQELAISNETALGVIHELEERELVRSIDDGTRIVAPFGEERLRLAVEAVRIGASIEDTASVLSWKEFESFCLKALEENGYTCYQEFRFKSPKGKRYECDVVAIMKSRILLADCKHYAGRVKGLNSVVKKHLERVSAFSRSVSGLFRKIPEISEWKQASITPIIVTLFPENIALIDGVPIVPVFKLNQFLLELASNVEEITHIEVKLAIQKRLISKTQ